jgi:hypothetical protein
MKVCGFSIANNAVRLGYPIEESLRSMLPLVDELILNIGDTDDETWDLVQSLNEPKIKPFRSFWDPHLRSGGQLLARQTNLALERCQGDWGLYLQADEVLHERDYPLIRQAMETHLNKSTESLRLRYHHFYGSFQTIQDNPKHWYTSAIRIIRLGIGASSWGDAMDFCMRRDGKELFLDYAETDAYVYHYGWCRPPEVMRTKTESFRRLYHEDDVLEIKAPMPENVFDRLGDLRFFRGTHPAVMQDRVKAQSWQFDHGIYRQPPDWYRHVRVWARHYVRRALPFAAKLAQRLTRRLKPE